MNNQTKKQLCNRNRLARRFLLAELRLSKYYEEECLSAPRMANVEELSYKWEVAAAAKKALRYAKNCSPQHYELVQRLQHGEHVESICESLHICKSTYHEWKNAIVKVFGEAMGVLE